MTEDISITIADVEYCWDGKGWYEAATYAVPPSSIVPRLNVELEQLLAAEDQKLNRKERLTLYR